jgi:hypothetical protein
MWQFRLMAACQHLRAVQVDPGSSVFSAESVSQQERVDPVECFCWPKRMRVVVATPRLFRGELSTRDHECAQ